MLDLPDLDPEAPDLDLVVDPADVDVVAVGPQAHAVPGGVHPRAVGLREGVRQEDRRRTARQSQVAPGQADAPEEHMALSADRHGPQFLVEHVRPHAADRRADRHPAGGLADAPVPGGGDGRLGRAVAVGHHQGGGVPEPLPVELGAAGDDEPHARPRQSRQERPAVGPEHGGGDLQGRHAEGAHGGEHPARGHVVAVVDRHAGARAQRHQDVVHRAVDRGGGRPQHDVVLPDQVEVLDGGDDQVDDPLVRHADDLGPSRRARRRDRVRQVERVRSGQRGLVGPARVVGTRILTARLVDEQCLGAPLDGRRGEELGASGVGEHLLVAPGRVAGGERQARGAGAQHGDETGQRRGAAGGQQADDGPGARAAASQAARQPGRGAVELRVRPDAFPRADGRGVRPGAHLSREEVDDGRPSRVAPGAQAEGPHVGPYAVDVVEARLLAAGEPLGAPAPRKLTVGGPDRVLSLAVHHDAELAPLVVHHVVRRPLTLTVRSAVQLSAPVPRAQESARGSIASHAA